MERYESLGLAGEGSYGTVLKCRHRDTGRLVAIKKFTDSDSDRTVKKIATREIKLLRKLSHDNLVNLLEVWKRRRRWYLVFEFVDRTLLEDLEQNPSGLDLTGSRQYLYQILRAAAFCHEQNIIHRDIKPENVLVSQGGVVKLCDFGLARTMASPAEGGVYTDYVATRWYRAPELLVGDVKYGRPVDVWAVGCLFLEMLTGQPLFPGDSDLDQIYHIMKCFGNLTARHQELFYRNPAFSGVRLPECSARVPLQDRCPKITPTGLDLAQSCLQMDPEGRAQCSQLLEHPLFTQDCFHIRFMDELNAKIQKDHRENSTLPKIIQTPRQDKDSGNDKKQKGKNKKQRGDVDERVNRGKEKKDRKDEDKTKGRWNLKCSVPQNKSDASLYTKQPKTSAANQTSIKGNPGKSEPTQEPDVCPSAQLLASEEAETGSTAAATPKHGKHVCPEARQEDVTWNTPETGDRSGHSPCDVTRPREAPASDDEDCRRPSEEQGSGDDTGPDKSLTGDPRDIRGSSSNGSPTAAGTPKKDARKKSDVAADSGHHSYPPPAPCPSPVLPPPPMPPLTAIRDHLSLGAAFYPVSHNPRSVDKPRAYGGIYSLPAHQAASAAAQDKSLSSEQSEPGNCRRSGAVAMARKILEVHFPGVQMLGLPELRGRDGKSNRGSTKDQRKSKNAAPQVSPSEPP